MINLRVFLNTNLTFFKLHGQVVIRFSMKEIIQIILQKKKLGVNYQV